MSDKVMPKDNPFCDNCKENDCCVSLDGTCAMVRFYLEQKDRFHCDEEGCKKKVTVCLCSQHFNEQSIY